MKAITRTVAVLTAVFMLAVGAWFTAPRAAHADDTWTPAGPYNNPFSSFLPDEEVKTALDTYKAGRGRITYTEARWLYHNGEWRRVDKYDNVFYKPGDRVRQFCAIVGNTRYADGYADYYISGPDAYLALDPENPTERISTSPKQVPAGFDHVTLFGADGYTTKVEKATPVDRWIIHVDNREITSPIYIMIEWTIPNLMASSYHPIVTGIASSANQPGGQSTSFFFKRGEYVVVNADFVAVDEFDYRKAMGLSMTDPIRPRSENDGMDSNKAFNTPVSSLPTIPGAETIRSTSAFGRGGWFGKLEVPIFRPEDSEVTSDNNAQESPERFLSPNLETGINWAGEKPRLSDVRKADRLPGYVLVGDDIDTTINAGTTNAGAAREGVVDGAVAYDATYALVYRSLARPVRVVKVDADNYDKKLEGAKFELRHVNADGTYSGVIATLTTNDKGEVTTAPTGSYDEMKSAVTAGTGANMDTHAYTVGQNIYVAAGKYVLTEIEAPEGYDGWADPIVFDVTAPVDENSTDVLVTVPNKAKTPDPDPAESPDTPIAEDSNDSSDKPDLSGDKIPASGDALLLASDVGQTILAGGGAVVLAGVAIALHRSRH